MTRRGRPPVADILTPREWEVLELLCSGLSNRDIAASLGITYDGVRFHVSNIITKLQVNSRKEAVAWYLKKERRASFAAPVAHLFGRFTAAILTLRFLLLASTAVLVLSYVSHTLFFRNSQRDAGLTQSQLMQLLADIDSNEVSPAPSEGVLSAASGCPEDFQTFRIVEPDQLANEGLIFIGHLITDHGCELPVVNRADRAFALVKKDATARMSDADLNLLNDAVSVTAIGRTFNLKILGKPVQQGQAFLEAITAVDKDNIYRIATDSNGGV